MSGRLTEGFREIIELRWTEFVQRERSLDSTNFDSVIVGIVRACKKGTLRAIQTGLDRLDGKVAQEIEVEMPQFYFIYPKAVKAADDPEIIDVGDSGGVVLLNGVDKMTTIDLTGSPADMDELHVVEEELPTGSLRAVLQKLLDSPKQQVVDILAIADEIDSNGYSHDGDPKVKSVIVAGLMKLVHDGRISAVFEVFDQIDGKVADKIKILGNDVFMYRYDTIAPAGATKNADGFYQISADNTTNAWALKLEQGRKR